MVNPADAWVAAKIRGYDDKKPLDRAEIAAYRVQKIRETALLLKERSPFFADLYKDIQPQDIASPNDITMLPLIDERDIIKNGALMTTVRQDEISRVVTLPTSGTCGKSKKIYFSAADQELTVDYFHHGMQCMCDKNDVFLILLPVKTPGSVGDLLDKGLKRLGACTIAYGPIDDYQKVLELMRQRAVTSLVAGPVSCLILAELSCSYGYDLQLRSLLLSTDYVPQSLSQRLSALWGCPVFEHYGMTEMGLGGGIFCDRLLGYHIRENDLYIEVVDPAGNPLPDGEEGELVFSTLTRQAMPLLRYRSGDRGSYQKGYCPCGSPLRLLNRVRGRNKAVTLLSGASLYADKLDELLFSLAGVLDYRALCRRGRLTLTVYLLPDTDIKSLQQQLDAALTPLGGGAIQYNLRCQVPQSAAILAKRQIIIQEE